MGKKVYSINEQIARLLEYGLDLSCYERNKRDFVSIGYDRLGIYFKYFKGK